MSSRTGIVVGAAALGASAFFVHAGMFPESQMFGRTLVAGTVPEQVVLTFDDGPNDAATPHLLELLDRHQVTATFFVIGRFARQRHDLVRAVHSAGHIVANHTFHHRQLHFSSELVIREELRTCNDLLENIIGESVRLFRPPHGYRRPAVIRIAEELGLTTVQWNVKGHDWAPIGADAIVRNLQRNLRRAWLQGRSANILLHDGFDRFMGADRSDTLAATDRLLMQFHAQKRVVVPLTTWLRSGANSSGTLQ